MKINLQFSHNSINNEISGILLASDLIVVPNLNTNLRWNYNNDKSKIVINDRLDSSHQTTINSNEKLINVVQSPIIYAKGFFIVKLDDESFMNTLNKSLYNFYNYIKPQNYADIYKYNNDYYVFKNKICLGTQNSKDHVRCIKLNNGYKISTYPFSKIKWYYLKETPPISDNVVILLDNKYSIISKSITENTYGKAPIDKYFSINVDDNEFMRLLNNYFNEIEPFTTSTNDIQFYNTYDLFICVLIIFFLFLFFMLEFF